MESKTLHVLVGVFSARVDIEPVLACLRCVPRANTLDEGIDMDTLISVEGVL